MGKDREGDEEKDGDGDGKPLKVDSRDSEVVADLVSFWCGASRRWSDETRFGRLSMAWFSDRKVLNLLLLKALLGQAALKCLRHVSTIPLKLDSTAFAFSSIK